MAWKTILESQQLEASMSIPHLDGAFKASFLMARGQRSLKTMWRKGLNSKVLQSHNWRSYTQMDNFNLRFRS